DSLEDLFRIMLGTSLHWPEPSLSAKRTEQRPRPTVALPPSCIAACFFSVSRTTSKTSSSLLTLTFVATSSPDRTVSAGKDSSYQSPPLCTVFVSDISLMRAVISVPVSSRKLKMSSGTMQRREVKWSRQVWSASPNRRLANHVPQAVTSSESVGSR